MKKPGTSTHKKAVEQAKNGKRKIMTCKAAQKVFCVAIIILFGVCVREKQFDFNLPCSKTANAK